MSDYSAHRQEYGAKKVAKAVAYAQTIRPPRKRSQLLPRMCGIGRGARSVF